MHIVIYLIFMKKLLLLAVFIAATFSLQAQLVINELMQSNIDCIMDDLNEFPDSWVELYNAGESSVNLQNYKLGITDNPAEAYQLPYYTLAPKAYKIVYCDKYDGNKNWHAPFRLESGKNGEVYLFKNGEIADLQTGMKKQPAPNIAYGRKTDGSDKWGYQAKPTPNAANCGTVYGNKDIVGDPKFSIPGQVYESSQSVELTLSLPEDAPEGAQIYYTMDGTEPALENKNSKVYSTPLKFSSNRVIRAKVICDGYLSPRSVAQSYLFMGRKMTLPVVSLVTNRDYFYSDKLGIYIDKNNNSEYKNDWRRPLNIEYFAAPNEESKINQLCETRVAGGGSRSNKYKTLVMYANKRFHEQKRFNYEFFPEDRPGITEFKSFMLRNSGNDFDYMYMRDAVMQRSFHQHVDIDYQGYSPAIIYINGTYLGMLNIRERSNEDNIYTNYGGLEDIDMFENWYELKTGTWDNFNAFRAFYEERGHTKAEFEEWMDCTEFLNLMIMNIFYSNRDFPGNNIVMWRPRQEGGRWRWIAKDTDFGLGLYGHPYDYKTINWLYDNNFDYSANWANRPDDTRLFRRMMDDPDLKSEFIDRCAVYMGDFLNVDYIWPNLVEPMYEVLKFEYPYHRKMINEWWPNYNDELNNAKTWLQKRVPFFYQHLADYYKLGTPMKLQINKELTETELADIEVEMNGVKLTRGVFDGKFFKNRTVKLSGEGVGAWKISVISSKGRTENTINGATCEFEMPESTLVSVNAVTYNSIEQVGVSSEAEAVDYFDLRGVRHDQLQRGQNIIRMSDGTVKKVLW